MSSYEDSIKKTHRHIESKLKAPQKELGGFLSPDRHIGSPCKCGPTLTEWVQANREAIDREIRKWSPGAMINDKDRKRAVMNDEYLYNRARAAGVRL